MNDIKLDIYRFDIYRKISVNYPCLKYDDIVSYTSTKINFIGSNLTPLFLNTKHCHEQLRFNR